MATESAYPDALPTLTDVPATFAELPKHSTQHNVNNADTVAIATKLGITSGFKGVERYANNAARDAALPTPTAGMVVSSGNVLQYNTDGTTSGWTAIGQAAALVTTGATAATGWTIEDFVAWRWANMLQFRVRVKRTGAAITVGVTGDITNTPIATLPASVRGNIGYALGVYSGYLGRVVTGYVEPDTGLVAIGACGGTADIGTNEIIAVGATLRVDY